GRVSVVRAVSFRRYREGWLGPPRKYVIWVTLSHYRRILQRRSLLVAARRRFSTKKAGPKASPLLDANCRYFLRIWIVQAEPRPMTWARPTFASLTWRWPASPRRCQTTSTPLATPVAPSGW